MATKKPTFAEAERLRQKVVRDSRKLGPRWRFGGALSPRKFRIRNRDTAYAATVALGNLWEYAVEYNEHGLLPAINAARDAARAARQASWDARKERDYRAQRAYERELEAKEKAGRCPCCKGTGRAKGVE